jgi:hypothetical protein
MKKQYRIQRSDYLGIVTRAFGGRCASWSPWRTVIARDHEEDATALYDAWSRKGLTRWRLMYGKEVIRKSE